MARPGVGNPGNKGGGRRSAFEEHQDAEWHALVWQNEQDVSELKAKIQSRKYSGREMAALKLLEGDKYLIGKFMDKLVPDLHDVTSKGETMNFIIDKDAHDYANYVKSRAVSADPEFGPTDLPADVGVDESDEDGESSIDRIPESSVSN